MSINIVVDRSVNDTLYPKYKKLIKSLYCDYEIVSSPITKEGVNFSGNRSAKRHRWFYYKEAYSQSVVERFIQENNIEEGQWVMDPFSGVGTTLLECMKAKIYSVGFDMSPLPCFVSEVKSESYSKADVVFAKDYVSKLNSKTKKTKNIPPYNKFFDLYSGNISSDILKIKYHYENCENKKIKNILLYYRARLKLVILTNFPIHSDSAAAPSS